MINKKDLKRNILYLLNREEIDEDESFIKYGGDSLFFGRLQVEIKKVYGLRIPIRVLFSNGNLNDLYNLLNEKSEKPKSRNLFKMTDLQKAYLLGRKEEMILGGFGSHAYFAFEGEEIDEVRLEAAIRKLVFSQEMLRAGIENEDTMYINEEAKFWCEYKDLRDVEEKEKKVITKRLSEEMFSKEFDIKKGPLIRFLIVRMDDIKTIVHLCHDGIIADGESHQIILRQLERYYYGQKVEEHIKFPEYTEYLLKIKETEQYKEAKEALSIRFDGYDMKPQLPLKRAPEEIKNPMVKIVSKEISDQQYKKLCEIAKENGVTVFALLLTIFGKVIGKYSYNEKFLINLPVMQRPVELKGIEHLIGLCSNFILLDFHNDKEISLMEQIKINQEKLFEIREYGMYFMGSDQTKLLRHTRKEEIIAPVVFTSTLNSKPEQNVHFRKICTKTYTSQVWLEGLMTKTSKGVLFTLSYVDEMFERMIPEKIADYFIETLNCIGYNECFLHEMTDIPLIETDRKIIEGTHKIIEKEKGSSFHEKLRMNFSDYKDKPVIIDQYTKITYGQLERFCKNIGKIFIQKYKLQTGDIVGIYMPKSTMQVACELALAYMNIPFIPLDYALPKEAIEYCIKNIGIKMLITDLTSELDCIQKFGMQLLRMGSTVSDYCEDTEYIQPLRNEIMILINTSGTTGFPKTVKLEKEGIINCIQMSSNIFGITGNDVIFNLTNYSHDMSIFDILGMSYIGGTIVIPDQKNYKNPDIWVDLMTKYAVTVWNSVPAFLEMLILVEKDKLKKALKNLKVVIQGGDYLQVATVKKIKEINQKCRVFNVGGPTETTIWNIYHEVSYADILEGKIPYGKPFPNTQYFILGKDMQLCPIGKEGVMYIAGEGVSPGYVGQDGQEKFMQYKDTRVYNSGDCGKYLENGEILFLGRKDRQVKINGRRIELDGIEKVMNSIEGVGSAAVIFQKRQKRIAAFYTTCANIKEKDIRDELAKQLPNDMLPTHIYRLSNMPINRNGKIDRKELERYLVPKKMDIQLESSKFEKELVLICQEIFWENEINLKDDFYAMGADSVSAMRIAAKVKSQFGIKLSPYDIFKHPNIQELARYISKLKGELNADGEKSSSSTREYKGNI